MLMEGKGEGRIGKEREKRFRYKANRRDKVRTVKTKEKYETDDWKGEERYRGGGVRCGWF